MKQKRIRKIGNSFGVILPQDLLQEVGVNAKTNLDIRSEGSRIIIEPINLTDHKIMKTFMGVLKDFDQTFDKLAK
ncbi:MAG: AbrB/MazE/SpoVT family DNA-binding domain-containing protein [Deltaproteobacteria bacterium]|nr:AbrB/MazE/SpoVT family DNA-binding domain-containing protein [Deltaproteobacteria bacterium]